MSAISPYKHGNEIVTVNDIAAGNSIAIGRGFEDIVSQKPFNYSPLGPTVQPDTMTALIQNAFLNPIEKNEYEQHLQSLMAEIGQGEAVNISIIQQQLTRLKMLKPDLVGSLRAYLENLSGLSTPVRILTRHCLS